MPRRRGDDLLSRQLGARIRTLREEAGITQEKLAWAADMTKGYLSRVESGVSLPSLPTLLALADVLHVEPAQLLAFDAKSPTTALLDSVRLRDATGLRSALRRLKL